MGQSASSKPEPTAAPAPASQGGEKKKLKPCCACPETRKARDECVYNDLKSRGVKEVMFGAMFPRHDRNYNKRRKRLNKILKMHKDKVWYHNDRLMSNNAIDRADKVHLRQSQEKYFSKSIRDALLTMTANIAEKGQENCKELIEAHIQCMRKEGFNI